MNDNSIETGGAAFPSEEYRAVEGMPNMVRFNIKGMTLRDWLEEAETIANKCYRIADAMLKTRLEGKG